MLVSSLSAKLLFVVVPVVANVGNVSAEGYDDGIGLSVSVASYRRPTSSSYLQPSLMTYCIALPIPPRFMQKMPVMYTQRSWYCVTSETTHTMAGVCSQWNCLGEPTGSQMNDIAPRTHWKRNVRTYAMILRAT